MITQKRLKELFDYDDSTGNLVWKVNRGTNKMIKKMAGTAASKGYWRMYVDYKWYQAHRLVWLWHHGFMPKKYLDHINGVRHDNRIENLREATHSENAQNQKKANTRNLSGLLGVSKDRKRWRSEIKINDRRIHIGMFATPEEAHLAYLAKKRELHPFQTIA